MISVAYREKIARAADSFRARRDKKNRRFVLSMAKEAV